MRTEAKRMELHNKFLDDYQKQDDWLFSQFDYNPYSNNVYHNRMNDLNKRSFNRDGLADVLYELNKRWDAPKETFSNIEKLRDEKSVVVIGGQQAGLLTGPLYTIHKIISIVTLAKEQQKKLGIPVLPVFWIAGEDHDYAEVNHIFLPEDAQLNKKVLHDHYNERVSVSNRMLDKTKAAEWLKIVFNTLEETMYTKELWALINGELEKSGSAVDFFASVIHVLFERTGLILIDSGDKKVRLLESGLFEQLIEKQPAISKGVYQALQKMRSQGYSVSVEANEEDGHLFIEEQQERILLLKEKDKWVGKNNECAYSTDELLTIANEQPERLSNNVVTRPLMQELLFPTLAFFAGPSEAGYWSILKPAFEALSLKMPPVLPRVSLTFIESKTLKLIEKYGLSLTTVLEDGVQREKQNWLSSQTSPPLELLAEQLKQSIVSNHLPFRELTEYLNDDMTQYTDKNLQLMLEQVNQLTSRLQKELEEKYHTHLKNFDSIELQVKPFNGLQERVWNIIYFLNYYGLETIQEIITTPYDWKKGHYIIYL